MTCIIIESYFHKQPCITSCEAQWHSVNWSHSGREVRGSHPGHATIPLGSNLVKVVYSHCLPSLLSSKKLGYKRELSQNGYS